MRFGSHRPRAAFRAFVLALCVGLAGPSVRSAAGPPPQTVVKLFTLKYRKAEDALARLRPLLSDSGAVSAVLETDGNSLTVRGTSGRVEQIARAIAAFDVPPRAFSPEDFRSVTTMSIARSGTSKADVSEE